MPVNSASKMVLVLFYVIHIRYKHHNNYIFSNMKEIVMKVESDTVLGKLFYRTEIRTKGSMTTERGMAMVHIDLRVALNM